VHADRAGWDHGLVTRRAVSESTVRRPVSVAATRAMLDEVGRSAGLVAVGFAGVEPFTDARQAIESRLASGQHAGMRFTFRNPRRSTTPAEALPGAATLVVGARAYPARIATAETRTAAGADGIVARYAVGDQHEHLCEALAAMADVLRADGFRARVLADDNALVDRAAAHRAGLGWYGKSANLLVPGHGPWVVLGAVLTDAPLAQPLPPVADGCGPCRRCLDACPTGAIVGDGVVDARRCLSWLLQDTGVFPVEHRVALGSRLYGCDVCLEVCPPGRANEAPVDEPGRRRDVVAMLGLDDEALLASAGRWYVARRDPRYLRRNLLVVLANVGDPERPEVGEAVRRHLAHPDPLVAAHAVWAARRLGLDRLLEALTDEQRRDRSTADELARPVERRPPPGSVPPASEIRSVDPHR